MRPLGLLNLQICDLNLVTNFFKKYTDSRRVIMKCGFYSYFHAESTQNLVRFYYPHAMRFHDGFFSGTKSHVTRGCCIWTSEKNFNPLRNARLTRQPTLHAGSSSTRIMFLEYNYCKKENSFFQLFKIRPMFEAQGVVWNNAAKSDQIFGPFGLSWVLRGQNCSSQFRLTFSWIKIQV